MFLYFYLIIFFINICLGAQPQQNLNEGAGTTVGPIAPVDAGQGTSLAIKRKKPSHELISQLSRNNELLTRRQYFAMWNDYCSLKLKMLYRKPIITPVSSETSGCSMGHSILSFIQNRAKHNVVIASDKCTNRDFIDEIMKLNLLCVTVVTSEGDKDTNSLLSQYTTQVTHHRIQGQPDKSGKMHNKFIIVDDFAVITGSPNCTFNAYNNNIESCVIIEHPYVAYLYKCYVAYIINGKDKYDKTQPEYRMVERRLNLFNHSHLSIKVCLAPIMNIAQFVSSFFAPPETVKISMFLVSNNPGTPNIMTDIMNAIDNGSSFFIKVDDGQYQQQRFMQKALQPLVDKGQQVSTVLKAPVGKSRINPLLHDKLIIMERINGKHVVIVGSAGFSTNVQQNLNLENMVALCLPEVYTFFLEHFNSITNGKGITVKAL